MKATSLRRLIEALEDRSLPSTYTVTDLGTFGGTESLGYAVNASGRVAGFATTADELPQAFRWDQDHLNNLGTLGGDTALALGINDAGHVVGTANTTDPDTVNGGQQGHAFLWHHSTMRDLGTVPGTINSDAWAINARDQVVGWSYNLPPDDVDPAANPFNSHPFVWERGVMKELALPAEMTNGFAGAVNESGVIAGNGFDGKTLHAIVWRKGPTGVYVPLDLGFPPGTSRSSLRGINNAGDVVGDARLTGGPGHAFWWRPDGKGGYVPTDLGTLGGPGSGAMDINNRGQIVGRSGTAGGARHAFLHDAAGMHDLNDDVPAGSDWVLDTARSINDRGQIVGVGIHHGQSHGFLLTPAGKDDRLTAIPGGWWRLHVRGDDEADTLAVVGLGADTGGGDSVEVTHNGTTTTFGNIVSVVVETGKGDDKVSFTGTWFAVGDVRVNLGAGDDTLSVEDATFAAALRLRVQAGAGNDVAVCGCNSFGGGVELRMTLGDGDDTATLEENTFAKSLQLTIDAGSGNDTAVCGCDSFGGGVDLRMNLGTGNDAATFHENTFAGPSRLRLDAGSGNDAVSMQSSGMHGASVIAIRLGAGDDTATVHANFDGPSQLTLDAGAGSDAVSMQCDSARDALTRNVNLGAGNDQFLMEGSSFAKLILNLDAGSGDDAVTIKGTTGRFDGDIDMGGGNDHLGVSMPLDPCLLIAHLGAGNDAADIQLGPWTELQESHPFLVDGGAGDDRIAMAVEVPKGCTGPLDVRVRGGVGDDDLSLFVTGDLTGIEKPSLLLDGGFGKDQGTASPDVTVTNC